MKFNPFHRQTPPSREPDLSYLLNAGRPQPQDAYSSFPPIPARQRPQPWANNPAMVNGHSEPNSPQKSGSDDEDQSQSQHAVGFWSSELKQTRRKVAAEWFRTIALLMFAVIGVLSLYWAVLFRANENLKALTVYVVDFDGQVPPYNTFTASQPALVGPTVTDLIEKTLLTDSLSLGYNVVPPSQFADDPSLVRLGVYDFKAWAAIIVNSNATTLLRDAVATGNSSYDPTGAMTVVYNTARDNSAVQGYVLPALTRFTSQFAAEFGPRWAEETMANTSLTRANLLAASQAVNPGVAPTMLDLRPFQPPTAVPAVSIGLIYLIIVSFFCFSFFMPIHKKLMDNKPPLKFSQVILYRYLSCIACYLLLSFSYAIVSLAFRIPFWPSPSSPTEPPPPLSPTSSSPSLAAGATAYGRGTWPVYWMLSFVGMTALGLACENMAMLLGQPLVSLWLIFWVITNVATSFYPSELAPGFYRWGYAWPLHQVVEGSRQLLFDLHSRIGLNFGVLAAWVAVGTALFPLCCWFMRWKEQRGK